MKLLSKDKFNKSKEALSNKFNKGINDDVLYNRIPDVFLKYQDYKFLGHYSYDVLEAQIDLEKNGILNSQKKYRKSYQNLEIKSPASHPVINLLESRVASEAIVKCNNWIKEKTKTKSGPKPVGYEEFRRLGSEIVIALALPNIHSATVAKDRIQKVARKIGHQVQDQLFIQEAKAEDKIQNGTDSKLFNNIIKKGKERPQYHYKMRYIKRRFMHNNLVESITPWSNDKAVEIGLLLIDFVYETGLYIDYGNTVDQKVHFYPTKKSEKSSKGYAKPEAKKYLVFIPKVKEYLKSKNEWLQWENPQFPIMLVKPRPWDDENTGAYLTDHIRNKFPLVITRDQSQVKEIRKQRQGGHLDKLFEAVNHAQETVFDVNPFMHEVLKYCFDKKIQVSDKVVKDIELISIEDFADKYGLSHDQSEWDYKWKTRFNAHRKSQRNLQDEIEYARQQFRKDHYISQLVLDFGVGFHIPLRLDWRGRVYCGSYFSYQREAPMKSRITFKDKIQLGANGIKALKKEIANSYGNGIDKMVTQERVNWVDRNLEGIRYTVENWKTDKFWHEADEQCLFLAAAKELIDALDSGNPENYFSGLICWSDASNSGLQHFSLALRDKVGAKHTNMTAIEEGQKDLNDFYIIIRDRVEKELKTRSWNDYEQVSVDQWEAKGVARGDIKQPAFTKFYNSGERGMGDQVFNKTMKPLNEKAFSDKNFEHPFEDYSGSIWASILMGTLVNDVVGEEARPAVQAMNFILEITAYLAMFGFHLKIFSPLAFPMVQAYKRTYMKRVRIPTFDWELKLRQPKGKGAEIKVKVKSEIPDTVCASESVNGAAPNTIHMMDSSQLILSILYAKQSGINSIALNHDCWGTHAANVDALIDCAKEAAVEIYSSYCPFTVIYEYAKECIGEEFEHPITGEVTRLPKIPAKGDWNIEELYESEMIS